MRVAPVFRFISYALFATSAAMLIPATMAMAHPVETATGYGVGIFICLFFGGLSFATAQTMPKRLVVRNGMRELFVSLLIFWGGVPFFAAVPFLAEGLNFGDAWFEAVSALTTTGGWISEPGSRVTAHAMLYRAILQWMGGLISIATAAAVFVRPEFIGVAPLVPPFSRGESGSFLRAFDRASWTFMPVYGAVTAIGALLLLFTGVPTVDAVTMALSLVASGGFIPAAGGIASYSPAAGVVASALMCVGAINFIVIAAFALGRTGRMRSTQDEETKAFLLLIPAVTLLYWIATGAGDIDRLLLQGFNAISLLSTNGQVAGEAPPLVPVLVTAVIGGAAVSTAGGIKLLRWLITIRRTTEELFRLTHPFSVVKGKPNVNEFGVWIHTLAFSILLAGMVLITAFFDHSLDVSAAAAVAVLTNSGPILGLAPNTTADFVLFDPALRWVFGIGMIAGRLELVVLLVMMSRRFWQG